MSVEMRNEVKVPLEKKRQEWNLKLSKWGYRQVVWEENKPKKEQSEQLVELLNKTRDPALAYRLSLLDRKYQNAARDRCFNLQRALPTNGLRPLELDELTFFDEDDRKDEDDEKFEASSVERPQDYTPFAGLDAAPVAASQQADVQDLPRKELIDLLRIHNILTEKDSEQALVALRKFKETRGAEIGAVQERLDELITNLESELRDDPDSSPFALYDLTNDLEREIYERIGQYEIYNVEIADCDNLEEVLDYLQR